MHPSDGEFRLRAVLVTGATSGIGQSICRALAEQGYAILAHYHRNVARALILQASLHRDGVYCRILQADLSESEGPAFLANQTRALVGEASELTLHGIVNNAAVLSGPSLGDSTPAGFDQIFAVNTRAPLLLVKELVSEIPQGGSIVNISSALAHMSSPGNLLYAMSKAALESFTMNLAEAVASRGLRVNAVIPRFTDKGHPAFQDPEALAYMSSFSPLGGVASPDTVAEAVSFLLSAKSQRTTGSFLDVSGGTTLAPRGDRARSVRDVLKKMS